jgi:hypothetical protein
MQLSPRNRAASRTRAKCPLSSSVPARFHLVSSFWEVQPANAGFDMFNANSTISTGEDAKREILNWSQTQIQQYPYRASVPSSATNFWHYEAGNFTGNVRYWLFDCGSRDACLDAVECLGGLKRDQLKRWQPSRYAVVMEGPVFYMNGSRYKKDRPDIPWSVNSIEYGLVYEQAHGDESILYFAIDLYEYRVYCHVETGGFDNEDYQPNGEGDRRS